nr:primosomal protein N' [Aliikangiella sp. G2MR2-5]
MIISVAITVPLRRCFDYYWNQPLTFEPAAGMRVKVPFGKTFKIGIIQQVTQVDANMPELKELKSIHLFVDQKPLLPATLQRLNQWMIRYYHAPPGEAWQTMLPTALLKGEEATLARSSCWRLSEQGKEAIANNTLPKNAVKQRQALQALANHPDGIVHEKLKVFDIPATTIKSLAGKKWVERSFSDTSGQTKGELTNQNHGIQLNDAQQIAVDRVAESFASYQAFLLFGVTASGKTEVYLRLIEKVIAQGKQALVLVPEIGLTPQTLKRFQDRFNAEVTLLHSGMTEKQRLQGWLKAREGASNIIIGTRSALFVPMANPGIIIIDEEHDMSFRQQQGFRYSARDLALVRANFEQIPVLLGSATPSVETLYNVEKNKIIQLELKHKAQQNRPLSFQVIDLKNQVLRQGLSLPLIESIRKHLDSSGQVLLFLNRRGYAPVLLCHQCGWSQTCQRCDVHYTYHHQNHYLQCHHCGSSRQAPKVCPQCQCPEMVPVGLGTERLEETVKSIFPEAKVARIDRDTTRRKSAMQEFVSSIKSGEVDILLGTQMLAKGHHFPNVTLVALIDMDGALYSADFRAPEYSAQLITQVAGRAGRANKKGEVIIQTHHSEHPMLHQVINQGYAEFAKLAIRERMETELPPHSFAAMFQAESPQIQPVKIFLNDVKEILDRYSDLKVEQLGPAPALYVKKAGKFRYQLLLQTARRNELHRLLDLTLQDIEQLASARKVRWRLEMDPVGDS